MIVILQINSITKTYRSGDFHQKALDNVSFNLRKNEFVSILGHSGSGKTTLLNIIGGLDRYDSGDIIINDISTKKYTDRDWDSYRNHSVGFVFQSYNLIPHQSVLSNVELALTISGISSKDRKERAAKALEEVGLKDHLHKQPNQLSGGQMQRVAIARALVNEPDILLADEPTGALDTDTSWQIMDLLKNVAKDRLVVMVTHNPELAREYSNRIIELKDGQIISDTNPFNIHDEKLTDSQHQSMGRTSMSFMTALSLSFNNLWSKKARTFLTAFAGSIGIIGIALILSLSNGVNDYITNIQQDTMSAYPITIESQSIDLESLAGIQNDPFSDITSTEESDITQDLEGIYSNNSSLELASTASSSFNENNLTAFKEYLSDPSNEIDPYVGANGVVYSYTANFDLFTYDEEETFINTDGSSFTVGDAATQMPNIGPPVSPFAASDSESNISELIPGTGDNLISQVILNNYTVLEGQWPEEYDEVVLAVNQNNEIDTATLYELGLLPAAQYEEILEKVDRGETIELDSEQLSYEDIMNQVFYLLPLSDYYIENDNGYYESYADDELTVKNLVEEKAIPLTIAGIVKPIEDATTEGISTPIAYTNALTQYLIDYTNESNVVTAQEAAPEINVLSGIRFDSDTDEQKIEDTYEYLGNFTPSEQTDFVRAMQRSNIEPTQIMPEMMPENDTILEMPEEQPAESFDNLIEGLDSETLLSIYDTLISPGTYDDNMENFGVVSLNAPASISIYADTFEDKEAISAGIEQYNASAEEDERITYTDFVGLIISSVTDIIGVITYVLIAFVSVSLIVSSIMIGIITYISVLERTKEIGILRSIGASKGNISTVFNAETVIIGLFSGLLGVGVTYLAHIPINLILETLLGEGVRASLTVNHALILIILSIVLSFVAGLIPSRQASQKDPVEALRSE